MVSNNGWQLELRQHGGDREEGKKEEPKSLAHRFNILSQASEGSSKLTLCQPVAESG